MAMADNWLNLTGQVIVVTGAAHGIGRAIAETLVAEGAYVALVDQNGDAVRELEFSMRQQNHRGFAVQCDVTVAASVAEAAARIRERLGAVTGLVNNAGVLRAADLLQASENQWEEVLAVNLTGYLTCTREFSKDMLVKKAGSVVHVSSIGAVHPQTGAGAYSVSKAGVLMMSRQLAAELGPHGIRSNAVCPGMIRDTAMSRGFYQIPGVEAARAESTAVGRVGLPIDIAHAALFLLSERSSYMTGAELLVDGGLSCRFMDFLPRPGFNDKLA